MGLATHLEGSGASCTVVRPGATFEKVEQADYLVNPREPADFQRLIQDLSAEQTGWSGILYLWGLDAPREDGLSLDGLQQAQAVILGGLLHLVQALASTDRARGTRVCIVTRGALLSCASGRCRATPTKCQ